jgi:hypothetical protein
MPLSICWTSFTWLYLLFQLYNLLALAYFYVWRNSWINRYVCLDRRRTVINAVMQTFQVSSFRPPHRVRQYVEDKFLYDILSWKPIPGCGILRIQAFWACRWIEVSTCCYKTARCHDQNNTVLEISTVEAYKRKLFSVPKHHDMKTEGGNEGNIHVFTLKLRTVWE